MSDTPKLADECVKLLDRGATIVLRKCGMGSYLAVSIAPKTEAYTIIDDAVDKVLGWDGEESDDPQNGRAFDDNMDGVVETDDFTPSQVLYRITEKATTGRIV